MEGEGDRVLSKKKLDELVRQVTGGGQGLDGGEGLTPDVEEVCDALYFLVSFLFTCLVPFWCRERADLFPSSPSTYYTLSSLFLTDANSSLSP